MASRTAILKGFHVLVHYRDGSRYTSEHKTQTSVYQFLESVNLTEVYTVVIDTVWSQPGEVVELEVHTFPPAGD